MKLYRVDAVVLCEIRLEGHGEMPDQFWLERGITNKVDIEGKQLKEK